MGQPVSHSLVKALRAVPDFTGLDDRTLLTIVGASSNLFWPAGSTVFEKGAPTEGLYIVLSGRVRIYEVAGDHEEDVVTVGPGGFFGEHSLLLDAVHSKYAQAVEASEVMVVPRESFQSVMSDNPEIVAHLMERMEGRLARHREEAPS